jgi:hypothetical protein
MTLTEFLLARIAEDEQAATAGISTQADPENGWGLIEYEGLAGLTLSPHVGHIHERVQGEHIIRWHPHRVLAECEAKRRIVELCAEVMGDEDPRTSLDEAGWISLAWELMYELAGVYADHPDFREGWRA